MKFLVMSFLAMLSLVTCDRPTGPEFRYDPKNPLHVAIFDHSADARSLVKHVRSALDAMVGEDRSAAAYEQVLQREGATCERRRALHCALRRARTHGILADSYYDFDISITGGPSSAAQIRICVAIFSDEIANRGKASPPRDRPPEPWTHACG